MIHRKVWALLVVLAIGGTSCGGAPSSTPAATASPPSQVWILQPQDGAVLSVNKPHSIKFQGASFTGLDQFEVAVSDGQEWHVTPSTTGSGGPQYGTMFYGQVSWTPHTTGDFTISVRATNASGASPWSMVHVTVVEIPPKQKPTLTPAVRVTPTATLPLWHGLAKMDANCRSGPGKAYDKTGFVARGATVEILGRDRTGAWLDLVNPNGKGVCWASSIAFEVEFEMASLPVAAAPPPPAPTRQKGGGGGSAKGCTVTHPTTGQTSCVSPCPAGASPGKACVP